MIKFFKEIKTVFVTEEGEPKYHRAFACVSKVFIIVFSLLIYLDIYTYQMRGDVEFIINAIMCLALAILHYFNYKRQIEKEIKTELEQL